MDSEKLIQLRQRDLSKLTPRRRAIIKLLFGLGPLTELESEKILPQFKNEALIVKPRTLQEVGNIFGRTRERIRQIQVQVLQLLGL